MSNLISFSGGKDSTAMVLKMLENNEDITDIIYVDTEMEFPEMYEHINKFEQYIERKITRLKFSTPFEDLMIHREVKRGKHAGQIGYGWPRPNARFCTTYKTQALNKYIRNKYKNIEYSECVGIAYDEKKRIRDKRYPLVEYKMTEKDCLEYCYSHGFDWNGLYTKFNRLSCFLCPLQSLKELEVVYNDFPKLWNYMRYLDTHCVNSFRIDYTLDVLEKRFNNEQVL